MRKLEDIPNVDAPTTDYPKGRIRDKDITHVPPIVGTPITELLYGDVIQFFQRLLTLGSVTANELPDNVTNGYQTIQALWTAILGQFTAAAGDIHTGAANNLYVTPLGLVTRVATEAESGIALLASNAEVIAGTVNNKIVTPAGIKALLGDFLATKIINIGAWDMLATETVSIANTVTLANIRNISVLIQSDAEGNARYPLDHCNLPSGDHPDGSYKLEAGQFVLYRRVSGVFYNTNFDNTAINRGWIIIQYTP